MLRRFARAHATRLDGASTRRRRLARTTIVARLMESRTPPSPRAHDHHRRAFDGFATARSSRALGRSLELRQPQGRAPSHHSARRDAHTARHIRVIKTDLELKQPRSCIFAEPRRVK
jgi:hypothetical protein